MSNTFAAALCATVLWVVCIASAIYELPRRPAGEAWVVTSSDKISSRPMLVRANVRFQTAAADTAITR
jgi:hypothetical protein